MTEKHIPNDTILYLNGVSVSFDGFKALNSLSMVIAPGEMRAIIGPNGAGKTTMMDVITGKTQPDSGDIVFTDAGNKQFDLTRFDEASVANLGVGRKFQKPSVIESLTVFDNLEMSLKGGRSIWRALFHRLSAQQADKLEDILQMGLVDRTIFFASDGPQRSGRIRAYIAEIVDSMQEAGYRTDQMQRVFSGSFYDCFGFAD